MAAYITHEAVRVCSGKQLLLSSLSVLRFGISVEPKRYIRGLRRKPVQVLSAEHQTSKKTQSQSETTKSQKDEWTKSTSPPEHQKPQESVKTGTQSVDITDHLQGLRFEKALPGDKRLGRLVSVASSRTFREEQGKILLEGRRLICDALDAGANPQTVFFSKVERLKELPLDKLRRATLIKVKFEEIKIWSNLVAPQGVMAVFSRPDPARLIFANRNQSIPLSLVCDNVRDPGNLGTMLRCAAAAGCHNVLLTKGCVDVWEPKVLRAAMGAHFRLPVFPSLNWDDIRQHLSTAVTVYVADSSRPTDAQDNVSRTPSKAGDYGWVSSRLSNKSADSEESDSEESDSEESDSEDEELSIPRLDSKLYYERWAQSPSALVIGGETHGLSPDAFRLAENNKGQRLFIPLAAGVDSLNSAMAASILLFEGRKQLLQLLHTSGKKQQPKAERKYS
ncbi:rRNA methyltransferase 3A, mitochondrial [Gouania willdenowi]|uniref:RNA 2-O ribose methyltransferase substrate binding domain-containing protein n=1 Tax=Gouania willdenowi TaxID=441366 RepID=A0A8C5DSX8_GOUWI|nr:rRNA methyltransferase 3, mitochondrial [Gouania willdenowi]